MILDSPTRGLESSLWREMSRLQSEMNRLLGGTREQVVSSYPAVNVWANEDGAVVTAELPGVVQDDLDISVVGDTLTIKGSRKADEIGEGSGYHRRERGHGRFMRALQLPFRVEPDEVSASLRNGTLSINLPRAQSDRPRKIAIKNS